MPMDDQEHQRVMAILEGMRHEVELVRRRQQYRHEISQDELRDLDRRLDYMRDYLDRMTQVHRAELQLHREAARHGDSSQT